MRYYQQKEPNSNQILATSPGLDNQGKEIGSVNQLRIKTKSVVACPNTSHTNCLRRFYLEHLNFEMTKILSSSVPNAGPALGLLEWE